MAAAIKPKIRGNRLLLLVKRTKKKNKKVPLQDEENPTSLVTPLRKDRTVSWQSSLRKNILSGEIGTEKFGQWQWPLSPKSGNKSSTSGKGLDAVEKFLRSRQ
ncbi:hypothetical protein CEXT_418701 [Caerostris extrusa]|uniref:Uncharacterized protein n=1 Tax=Caerostris extrusa TaxID=172846 RepID=A0AAV4TCG0_CAEEX|nr:hypothetical protein CEXT_418701 [Caerostris extrusa]